MPKNRGGLAQPKDDSLFRVRLDILSIRILCCQDQDMYSECLLFLDTQNASLDLVKIENVCYTRML